MAGDVVEVALEEEEDSRPLTVVGTLLVGATEVDIEAEGGDMPLTRCQNMLASAFSLAIIFEVLFVSLFLLRYGWRLGQ